MKLRFHEDTWKIKWWNVTACVRAKQRTINLLASHFVRIFKHAICSLFCDCRSDVNRGSIQLFSSTGATKPILSLQEGKTRPVARLLIHSWSRHAASSRSSLPYPIIYGAQCRLIMARADMSLIRPGQTYARYSNIKPRARTPFRLYSARPTKKKKKRETSSGRIEHSLNPDYLGRWTLFGKCSPILSTRWWWYRQPSVASSFSFHRSFHPRDFRFFGEIASTGEDKRKSLKDIFIRGCNRRLVFYCRRINRGENDRYVII